MINMKPDSLPEKPKAKTAPLKLSCDRCKSDEDYVILLEDGQTFYCTNCDSVVDNPVGTQPVKTRLSEDSPHTRRIINSDDL